MVPDPSLVRGLVEGENARPIGGKWSRAKAVLRTRSKRSAWRSETVLIVTVVADMGPIVRHVGHRAGELLGVVTGDDRNGNGPGWSLDCQGRDRGGSRPAVSDFAWSNWLESRGSKRVEERI